jgi:diadenosine tetraphosphate (Ap4A) HIT family hydrolase
MAQHRPTDSALPDFVGWPTFPFEGNLRVRKLDPPAAEEPPRQGERGESCAKCQAPDADYIWVDERWRVRALGKPSGLPAVVVLETRHHYDMGDLSNLLAAELGVLTVRLERAIRSISGVARVHVNRWGDGSEHLHVFFLARPTGMLQLRGTFLSMWDDILPPIAEEQWRENLAFIAAWLAEYGGRAVAVPPPMHWDELEDEEPADAETALAADSVPAHATPPNGADRGGDGSGVGRSNGADQPELVDAGFEDGTGSAQEAHRRPPKAREAPDVARPSAAR